VLLIYAMRIIIIFFKVLSLKGICLFRRWCTAIESWKLAFSLLNMMMMMMKSGVYEQTIFSRLFPLFSIFWEWHNGTCLVVLLLIEITKARVIRERKGTDLIYAAAVGTIGNKFLVEWERMKRWLEKRRDEV